MKKFLKFIFWLTVFAILSAGLLYFLYSKDQADTLSAARPLDTLFNEVRERPDYVPGDQIPEFLKEATVSVEDARFYDHDGLDYWGLIRAALSQFIPIFDRSGGSTITQQVVKNLYGRFEGGIAWKGSEMLLALQLEKMYSKDEILTVYLNIINYGDNYTGIAQASSGYFQCLPMNLNEAESSLLAGIPQSPAYFALNDHFANAKNKQKIVLESMVRNHYISEDEADQIYAEPINYVAHGQWMIGTACLYQQKAFSPLSFLSISAFSL